MIYKAILVILLCILTQQSVSEISDEEYKFLKYTDIHQDVCKLVENDCLETNITSDDPLAGPKSTACCGRCSCKPNCFEIGNCCLKMYNSFSYGNDVVSKSRYECVKPQYVNKTISKHVSNWWYWMVIKCPVDDERIVDDNDRQLCEHPGLNGDLGSLQPVSDVSGTTHFMNKYCAFCNGRYDISSNYKWKLEVYCDEIISLTDENFLDIIVQKKCNILYEPPSNAILTDCKDWPKYYISTCNETGKWDSYDEFMERACNAFVDPFNQTYKNYFCMLCNTPTRFQNQDHTYCVGNHDNIISVSPPFFAILDIDLWKEQQGMVPKLTCNPSQFMDTKLMRCHDILCHPSRYLDPSSNCRMPENDSSRNLCYELFIKLKPIDNVNWKLATITEQKVIEVLPPMRHMQLLKQESPPGSTIFNYVLVHGLLNGDTWFVKSFERLHNSKIQINVKGTPTDFMVELGVYNVSENIMYDEVIVTHQENISKVDIFLTPKIEAPPYSNVVCPAKISYTFNKLLYCPFIKLYFDEFRVTMENEFLRFWRKSHILMTLLKWEYRLTDDGVFICLDDYLQINNALPDAELLTLDITVSQPTYVGPKRILSFICVCMSILCLLVTIAVYICLSELRTQPGVNNLILCVCLLFAQSVYQFAAGQPQHSRTSCAVVGAICHFLWLSVMFALNSCSVQMFMIFRSHAKLLTSYHTRTTVTTLSYVIGSSLAFVVVTIIVSLVRSSGVETGYGGNVCFIKAYSMHIITFVAPSFVIIMVNLFLFVFVLYKMREYNIRSTRLNQERSYLRINARLSTLTGLTWLFGFLQILVRNDVLEYLYIILNASQGVFIMVAFICNKRVYSLLLKKSTRKSSDVAVITKQTSIPN